MIETIKLSKNITVHRAQYNWKYTKEDLEKRVKQNLTLIGLSDLTTSPLVINSPEIIHYKNYARKKAFEVLGTGIDKVQTWVEKHWLYASNRRFTGEGARTFHTHDLCIDTYTSTAIYTDISYCFYLNVPDNLTGNEGKLTFKDGNEEISILPSTGDILFFDPMLLHKPNYIPNANGERLCICSNLTVNVKELQNKTSLL